MRTITATYQLVTPAFAGGAFAEGEAQLRIEAVVGQLRRWWWARAPLNPAFVNEGQFDSKKATHFADALLGTAGVEKPDKKSPDRDRSQPRAQEIGACIRSSKKGQGAFLIAAKDISATAVRKDRAFSDPPKGEELFGPLWGKRCQVLWSANGKPPTFTLAFTLRPKRPCDWPEEDHLVAQLKATLTLWGLLGGIGAGQRRGFGSVQLLDMVDNQDPSAGYRIPTTIAQHAGHVIQSLGLTPCSVPPTFQTGEPRFAAFVAASSLTAGAYHKELVEQNSIDAMELVAKTLRQAGIAHGINPPEPAINLLSDQHGSNRVPSPYHLHFTSFGGRLGLIATVLPRADIANPSALQRRIELSGQLPKSLFERLGMKKVLPSP